MHFLTILVNFAVTILHVLAALFLAYGAYLAIYGRQIWPKSDPQRERSGPRHDRRSPSGRNDRRLRVRRRADRLAMRIASAPR